MNQEKIGKFIRDLRIKKGWTQEELAKRLYVTRQLVSNIELGETMPTYDKVASLAKIFNVGIVDIYSGEKSYNLNNNDTNKIINYLVKQLNSKYKRLAVLFSIFIFLFFIVFLTYYFFNTYNTVKIYNVYGENGSYKTDQGLLILTRDRISFKISILEGDLSNVKTISLKYKNDKKESTIVIQDDPNISIMDFSGYKEYFDYYYIINNIGKFYIEITNKNDLKDIIDLDLTRIYENNNLIFSDKNKIVDSNESNFTTKVPKKIKENFKKTDDQYILTKRIKYKNITLSYSEETNIFNVIEESKDYTENWNYDIELGTVYYLKYKSNGTVIKEEGFNIFDDSELIIYFKEEYVNLFIEE